MPIRFPSLGMVTLCLVAPARLDGQDHRAALLAAERSASQLSSDSGLTVAVVRALHPRGVLLWPGAPVVAGLHDVNRLLGTLPNRDSLRLTWQPLGIQLAGDSTLGVTWGVAVGSSRLAPDAPRIGRYVSVRRRDAGRWTIAALLFLAITPATPIQSHGLKLTQNPVEPSGAAAPFIVADLDFARLAADSGAAVAFRRWAAGDAIAFGSGGLLTRGPEAIGQAVAGSADWRWHPVAAGAAEHGDLGWTVGEAVITPRNAPPDYGKYLTVWIRSPGERARFLIDGGNGRPPTP